MQVQPNQPPQVLPYFISFAEKQAETANIEFGIIPRLLRISVIHYAKNKYILKINLLFNLHLSKPSLV